MSVTEELASFLVETNYKNLPDKAIEIAKERFLDTIGVALAGSQETSGKIGIGVVKEWGEKPISTVIGGGFKTSSPNAAFANGISAHALDYDDTTSIPLNHFNAALIPATLALAEQVKASGKKVLESYVVAYEVGTRVGLGFGGKHYFELGWHPPSTWGAIGTTAVGAKLLNLTTDQTRAALGIVASAAGGIRKQYGTNTKPLHCGYSARNGVIAAILAQKDFTANKDVLDQSPDVRSTHHMYFSFPQVFCGEGNYDLKKMTEGLGSSYQLLVSPVITKFHPGPTAIGNMVDLLLEMMKKHNFKAVDVERIECEVPSAFLDAAGVFPTPTCGDEARYSLHYQMAVAVLDGEVGIDQHHEKRISEMDIKQIIKKIHVHERPDVGTEIYKTMAIKKMYAAKITVKLSDNREFSVEQEQQKTQGDKDIPLNKENLLTKYRNCAKRAINEEKVEHSIELIDKLEKLANISKLMTLLE